MEDAQYYSYKYFNGNSLWERIKVNPCVQKLMDNKWLCTRILRQQEGVFFFIYSNAILYQQIRRIYDQQKYVNG
jgi:hypothetical protein